MDIAYTQELYDRDGETEQARAAQSDVLAFSELQPALVASQSGEVVDLDPGRDRTDGFARRVERVVEGIATNLVNLSTALGLAIGLICMGQSHAPHQLYRIIHVSGCRHLPAHGNFVTIGNVLLTRTGHATKIPTPVLVHEGRHSTQYAFCGGLAAIPLYGAASLASFLTTHDWSKANIFEVRAGEISAEGYSAPPDSSKPIRAWIVLGVIICGLAAILTSLITVLTAE